MGTDGGIDLSDVPDDPIYFKNIIYGSKIWPGDLRTTSYSSMKRTFNRKFGDVAEEFPVHVFTGWNKGTNKQWGATNEEYGERILEYLEDNEIGFSIGYFSDDNDYRPNLLDDIDDYESSHSGELVKDHIREYN
jgi:hypothetical protein